MRMEGGRNLNQDKELCRQSIISHSEEALRVFWKSLVTSVIQIVRWYVSEMVAISRSVGAARTGD